jgi:hypothetical protein
MNCELQRWSQPAQSFKPSPQRFTIRAARRPVRDARQTGDEYPGPTTGMKYVVGLEFTWAAALAEEGRKQMLPEGQ